MKGLPAGDDFRSPAHAPVVSARLGRWLGIAVGACFLTGLISHLLQHPPAWLPLPTRPVNLYRLTQGVHVLTGIAAVPLLLAKLWSVYPRLFARPPWRLPRRLVAHALERLSILILLGAVFFELTTGLFNVAQSYAWRFSFPAAHYAIAWITAGSLLIHIGVKLPTIRRALARPTGFAPEDSPGYHGRRAFLGTTAATAGAAVLATAGVTVPGLVRFSPLAWCSGRGPQGLPVNRTAAAAGVEVRDDWRLEITWPGGHRSITLAELAGMPQRSAVLPIACVEGWSASATWAGVPIVELLARLGAPTRRAVRVSSLDKGRYGASVLPAGHAADRLSLLALRLNGEPLSPDHGYPCRVIAPNRPGVLQTKWVTALEVL